MKLKPIIIENSIIPQLLSQLGPLANIEAITIGPLIICRGELSQITKQHESIHVEQYNDLLVIGFFLVYYFDYLHGIIKYRNDISGTNPSGKPYLSAADKAYYRIRAEQEAYEFEGHRYYLLPGIRKRWKWLKKYKV